MSGTFNVSRDLWDDAAFRDEPFSEREAWLWLLSEASWKPRERRVGSCVVALDRGQLAHSTRFMAERWKWTHAKVRRFLERIENLSLVRRETGTGVSVVTICKYDQYQAVPRDAGTAPAQHRHSTGTNEKKGEIREEGNTQETNVSCERARKRATRLPEDWQLPRDWGVWALNEGWPESAIRHEAETFKDYWISAGGQKARKVDWFATWRNWMRRVPKQEKHNGRTEKPSGADIAREVARRAAERMGGGPHSDTSQPLLPAGQPGGCDDAGADGLGGDAEWDDAGSDYPRLRLVSP